MTHNPEFTCCEFYMAYADYGDLMQMTEDMVSQMVYAIHGSYKIRYNPDADTDYMIDFTTPWKRMNIQESLEEMFPGKMPKPENLHLEESRKMLDDIVVGKGLECSAQGDKIDDAVLSLKCDFWRFWSFLGFFGHFRLFWVFFSNV